MQLLYLLLVQLFPNHTRVHVITLQIRLGMAQMSLHKYPADLYVCINVSPKGGYWGAPPTFLALYPLMWSLECIKFFHIFISIALPPSPFRLALEETLVYVCMYNNKKH